MDPVFIAPASSNTNTNKMLLGQEVVVNDQAYGTRVYRYVQNSDTGNATLTTTTNIVKGDPCYQGTAVWQVSKTSTNSTGNTCAHRPIGVAVTAIGGSAYTGNGTGQGQFALVQTRGYCPAITIASGTLQAGTVICGKSNTTGAQVCTTTTAGDIPGSFAQAVTAASTVTTTDGILFCG